MTKKQNKLLISLTLVLSLSMSQPIMAEEEINLNDSAQANEISESLNSLALSGIYTIPLKKDVFLKKGGLKKLRIKAGNIIMKPKKKDYTCTVSGDNFILEFKNNYKGSVVI